MKHNLFVLILIVLIASLAGCAGSTSTVGRADISEVPGVNSSNLTSRLLSKDIVRINSVSLSTIQTSAASQELSLDLATQNFAEAANRKLEFSVSSNNSDNVDGRFVLNVGTFKNLRGSVVGASEGAEVGFNLKLIDRSGQVLWTADFFHKDRALTDNILALNRSKGDRHGWSDANQVLRRGLEQAFQVFNNTRRSLFLKSNS